MAGAEKIRRKLRAEKENMRTNHILTIIVVVVVASVALSIVPW